MRSMRKWDPGHNDDANFSSSDDEDEMSRLKPRDGNQPSVQQQQQQLQQQQQQQQQQQNNATPIAGKPNKSSRGTRTGAPSSSFGRNYFLGPHPTSGSGATSPNDSDNTYAEASLLAHGRYEHNSSDGGGQNLRNDEDLMDYDSEIYANGALESGANQRYQQILQQRSPIENSRQIQGYSTRDYRHNQQLPETSKSPFLSSSTGSTRTNARSSSSMASSGRLGGNGSSGSSGSAAGVPPMLPSEPPGARRQGGHLHLAERGWETPGNQYSTADQSIIHETRLGPRDGDHLRQFNQSATLMAGERRNRIQTGFGTGLHRRSLSDESLGKEKGSASASHLHHTGGGLASPEPVVMPGFPVRTLQSHPPPPYSPTRDKFLSGKKCQFHCSWKLVALALTLLTLVLSSVIAYFGAVMFPSSIQSHAAIPESVISPHEMARLECPTLSSVDQPGEFGQGGKPQAVLPQGGQGFGIIPEDPAPTSSFPPVAVTSALIPGQWYTVRLEPMTFWRSKLSVRQPSHYQMNLTVVSSDGAARAGNLAVYGREGQAPTVTSYDWVHMVSDNGETKTLVKRSPAPASQNSAMAVPNLVTVDKLLTSGEWFIGVLNDGDDGFTVRAVLGQKRHGKVCVNDCSGHGTCDDGVCRCFPQFSGQDCSLSVCPLLCSGHGVYGGGQCHCVDGWKGSECDVRETECLVPDCSDHGHCQEGVCICKPGWTGEHCQTKDCYDRRCSGHGNCFEGNCVCDIGWMGRNCEKRNEALSQCLPDCSGHGRFDVEHGKCECQSQWTGRDCNISLL